MLLVKPLSSGSGGASSGLLVTRSGLEEHNCVDHPCAIGWSRGFNIGF